MTGTSAGASLCVYLAAMLKSPELAKAFQVVPNDLKIRALGLASGMYYTTKPDSIGIFLPPILRNTGKEFVLSIYKSGKQRNYPKPATVISGHSLWRYSSKLQ